MDVLPLLDDATLAATAARVRPRADELRWLEIPWESKLWAGRDKAARLGRPIFLWGMNGNPLGCV